jgi:hypothetical protein
MDRDEVEDSAGDEKACGSFEPIVQNALPTEGSFARAKASAIAIQTDSRQTGVTLL